MNKEKLTKQISSTKKNAIYQEEKTEKKNNL